MWVKSATPGGKNFPLLTSFSRRPHSVRRTPETGLGRDHNRSVASSRSVRSRGWQCLPTRRRL